MSMGKTFKQSVIESLVTRKSIPLGIGANES